MFSRKGCKIGPSVIMYQGVKSPAEAIQVTAIINERFRKKGVRAYDNLCGRFLTSVS